MSSQEMTTLKTTLTSKPPTSVVDCSICQSNSHHASSCPHRPWVRTHDPDEPAPPRGWWSENWRDKKWYDKAELNAYATPRYARAETLKKVRLTYVAEPKVRIINQEQALREMAAKREKARIVGGYQIDRDALRKATWRRGMTTNMPPQKRDQEQENLHDQEVEKKNTKQSRVDGGKWEEIGRRRNAWRGGTNATGETNATGDEYNTRRERIDPW